ncbi:MAG: CPBP family intramembrane metalloprotease [Clostridia bacterium]|nr:CPBP family intramembrane metalloprotease [Clostridia bacterium]
MKSKNHLYAPILFGVVLILAGLAPQIISLVERFSDQAFLSGIIVQLLVYLLPLAFYAQVRSLNLVTTVKMRYVVPARIPFLSVITLLFLVGTMIFRYFGLFVFPSAFVETPSALPLSAGGANSVLTFLCTVLLPALLEEVLFRGILLEEYRPWGSAWAVGVSSLMFAMLHLSAENFLFYLFMGVIFGVITVASDSVLPAIVLHVFVNYSHANIRPSVVEYLRQAGKSPLLPYLLFAVFLLLMVMLFGRLENLYRNKAYDELLRSRKELLRQEVEKVRELREGEEEEAEKKPHPAVMKLKEIALSPSFLVSVVIYICLLLGIFS